MPSVYVTSIDKVINRLSCDYWPAPGSSTYAKTTLAENATSQTSFGVRDHEAKYQYLHPDSISHMTALTVTNSAGFLANRHYGVKFSTKGLSWTHLEIGDGIQFDPTTVDPHIKFINGTSWSGETFVIIKKSIDRYGTNFEAMQLT